MSTSAMTRTAAEAAAARAEGVAQRTDRPQDRRCALDAGPAAKHRVRGAAQLRAGQQLREVQRNGLTVVPVGGCASVTESGYEMYDWYGAYTEIVSAGAFGKTLAASPRVEFTLNHNRSGGAPMALTENDTLVLAEDETGLDFTAYVDPTRGDVADMLKAIERRDLTQASFKFWITAGQWSPDYTEFRINETDLDGGDVSSVNFGANPAAWTELRSATRSQRREATRRVLRSASRQLTARALSPADTTALATLLLELTAADAVLDPIVDALCAADCALDSAQLTLATMLGLPAPDMEETDPSMQGPDGAGEASSTLSASAMARARAAAAL